MSPKEQVERIRSVVERDGLRLVATLEEPDVSGGTPLAKRHGLRRAVELVEQGDADVLVVAHFDRLVRSVAVQAEVAERVEKSGGAIPAEDGAGPRTTTAPPHDGPSPGFVTTRSETRQDESSSPSAIAVRAT